VQWHTSHPAPGLRVVGIIHGGREMYGAPGNNINNGNETD